MVLKPIPIEIIRHYDPELNSEKELIETMYKTYTLAQMEEIIGYSRDFFRKRMKKYGILIRPKKMRPDGVSAKFLAISEDVIKNMTQKQIAKKIVTSQSYACELCAKHRRSFRYERKGMNNARTSTNKK